MGKKTKTRLLIMMLGWYLTATTWLGAYIYNNYLNDDYIVAFWLTCVFHYLSLYISVAHYSIEGKDE